METDNPTQATDDHAPSLLITTRGYPVLFNERDVLFPGDVEPSSLERRRYIIAEFNLVKKRMREEEDKYRADPLPGEQSTSEPSQRSALDKVEIGKSTLKGWRKLLEGPIDFTWERPGHSENNNVHFDKDQQDVAIMYAFHEFLEASRRDRCTKKGKLAKAILMALDDGVMDNILASPPASDSTTDSSGSRSSGSSGSGAQIDSPEGFSGNGGDGDDDSADDSDYESASSGSGSGSGSGSDSRDGGRKFSI